MDTIIQTAYSMRKTTKRVVSTHRRTALFAGIFYLLTFVSIPTLSLYQSVHQPNYLIEGGSDSAVILGGFLEIIVALSGIATAVILFPVLKKQHEGMALGLVVARVLEAGTMFVGVAFLLTIVSLKQAGAGVNALIASQSLVSLYDRIFLLGQGFIPGINDLLLGFLLYKSRLVPRILSIIGIVGALPLFAGYLAMMFGITNRISTLTGLSAAMVAIFEFSLGFYLVVKGFKTVPLPVEN